MVTPTYIPLATVTLASADSSITFSSIPAGYRDLILIVGSAKSTSGNPAVLARVNSDSGSNYSYVRMIGNGSTATSAAVGSLTSFTLAAGGIITGEPATMIAHFMDYSATDKHKTILSRHNLASANVEAFAQRWANTAAVHTIEVLTLSLQFASGTTISLYGIH